MIKSLFKTENGETVITKHLSSIFKENEPEEKCTLLIHRSHQMS